MPPPERSLFYRIQHAAAQRIERFARAVAPSISAATPFSGEPQSPGRAPPPNYNVDQPPPASPGRWIAGYSDHTYRGSSQPIGTGGFTVSRMYAAREIHDTGASFLETSLLASACTRFAPVHAALAQCLGQILGLPRYVRGGSEGLSAIVAREIEAQLCPSAGALDSIYFPETLWGAVAIEIIFMNFAVLQHVDGDPDPVTGVRPRFTRRWPVWATTFDNARRIYVAQTTEGPADILNDGHFTLIADEEVPHLNSAIRALAPPALSGVLGNQGSDAYLQKYADPKPIGTMPADVATETPEGQLFLASMRDFKNPGGIILLPNGSTLDFAQLEGVTSSVFADTDKRVWQHIATVLLGTDATMTNGTGGVYTSPQFEEVKRSINGRRLAMEVRGVNRGHVLPYVTGNYAADIEEAKAAGETWTMPVLDIPLPDPGRDARIDADIKHLRALTDQVKADRDAGFVVDADRVKYLEGKLEVRAPKLADVTPTGAQSFGYDQENGVITIGMRLAELGKEIDDPERAAMTVPEYRAHLDAKREKAKVDAEAEAAAKEAPAEGDGAQKGESV